MSSAPTQPARPAALPRDAATVLLLRGHAPFEIFMAERGRTAKFMARAMVFPGGRVDDADADPAIAADLDAETAARRLGLPHPLQARAFYVAAARETFEETGVLLATRDGAAVTLTDPAEAARFAAHREALNAKAASFAAVLAAEGLRLSLAQLHLHAHWITPPIEKRRYDTRFFMARVPPGQQPLHDHKELVSSAWLSPEAALAAYTEGALNLAPPTLRVLIDLARCADVEAASSLQREVPPAIQPQPHLEAGELHLLLPGDARFSPPGPGRDRIIMRAGRWISERAGTVSDSGTP